MRNSQQYLVNDTAILVPEVAQGQISVPQPLQGTEFRRKDLPGGLDAAGAGQTKNADGTGGMACGDGSNDLEMIRMAGVGVAMENGTNEVKNAADYITESNEEDGAAKAIEKIVLEQVIPKDVFHRIK